MATAAPPARLPGLPTDLECGRDLNNGEQWKQHTHFKYDPNSKWHRFKLSLIEPPKSTVSIYADIPFNHAEWKRHRNAAWRHRVQPILVMRVAGGFWWQLSYSFVVSVLVGLYHHHFPFEKSGVSALSVPFNLTTFALSLLLVFRTNSSYSRWWEARQIWGAVVNLSRNFGRQSMLWLPPEKARVAVRWMMAAPYLLKCHLRFNADVRENVFHILLPRELEWVTGWTHRPNGAAHVLATAVAESNLDTNRELVLMELVNAFIDCVGKCERIFKTPIPAAYTRHTSRYLMMYLTACPFVLWASLGWWTPIAAVLITFLLLGTENIGVQIEEPFRVLPLDDMCRGIEATLREMERQHNKLGEEFITWEQDPENLSRATSHSSLGDFQDGPQDGPSQPEALERFHHIPVPPQIQAAAQLLLRPASIRRGSGSGTAGEASASGHGQGLQRRGSGSVTSGLYGLLHQIVHHGGSGEHAALLPHRRGSHETGAGTSAQPRHLERSGSGSQRSREVSGVVPAGEGGSDGGSAAGAAAAAASTPFARSGHHLGIEHTAPVPQAARLGDTRSVSPPRHGAEEAGGSGLSPLGRGAMHHPHVTISGGMNGARGSVGIVKEPLVEEAEEEVEEQPLLKAQSGGGKGSSGGGGMVRSDAV